MMVVSLRTVSLPPSVGPPVPDEPVVPEAALPYA